MTSCSDGMLRTVSQGVLTRTLVQVSATHETVYGIFSYIDTSKMCPRFILHVFMSRMGPLAAVESNGASLLISSFQQYVMRSWMGQFHFNPGSTRGPGWADSNIVMATQAARARLTRVQGPSPSTIGVCPHKSATCTMQSFFFFLRKLQVQGYGSDLSPYV